VNQLAEVIEFPSPATPIELDVSDIVEVLTAGGGGWGPPPSADGEKVALAIASKDG
jgi:hypothetical protein